MHWTSSYSRKMLFKFGLTVIIFVAVYIYFAKDHASKSDEKCCHDDSASNDNVVEDHSHVQYEDLSQDVEAIEADARTLRTRHFSEGLHIAVVACGDRVEETLIMLKSAVLLSNFLLVFHIFAENNLHEEFQQQLEFWPPKYRQQIEYHIYNISFPDDTIVNWKTLFKPCASQRLFIPVLLQEVDSLVYVDTDVLFLSPVEGLWAFFSQFNSSQLAAVAPEHEDRATGWYNRFARHPFYGELGVNSGVMLMNLTRLRNSTWLQDIMNYSVEYKLKITFGDQDLINIYFHDHPDELYVFACEWNYRPDHCMYMSVCKQVEETGVRVLHGCRRVWHLDKQPAFKAVYTTFKQHRLGASIEYDMLESMEHHLKSANVSNCGKLHHKSLLFTKQIQSFISDQKTFNSDT